MFENRADIQPFLAETELGLFAAEIAGLCRPSVCFVPSAPRMGGTRFGGEPDLPPGFSWPSREAYAHGASVAERLATRGAGFASQFTVPAPLDFVCQVDLTDPIVKRALGPFLPQEGRLQFFWDGGCGPWIEVTESARVVWDTSPVASLEGRKRPQTLQDYLDRDQRIGFKREANAAALPAWSLPDRFLLQEIAESAELRAASAADESDDFWGDVMDTGLTTLASGRTVLAHRLGGWPIPEQGDPRFTAAAAANGFLRLFDRSPIEAEVEQCSREVSAWTMLLQVDMASLGTDFAEGTVYFVMRADDLQRRDFDRVHAIYQQT
jgi:uncharacterized protein YwqG